MPTPGNDPDSPMRLSRADLITYEIKTVTI